MLLACGSYTQVPRVINAGLATTPQLAQCISAFQGLQDPCMQLQYPTPEAVVEGGPFCWVQSTINRQCEHLWENQPETQ